MGKGARKRQKRKEERRTPLSGHKRQGKKLDPPFVQAGLNKGLVSWMNDRLPEMIWAALLIAGLGRESALSEFRQILRFVFGHPKKELLHDCTLSGFSALPEELQSHVIGFLCRSESNRKAPAPLLLFEALPGRSTWAARLGNETPNLSVLVEAVRLTLFHQSQEATDCRWVRLMGGILGGKMIMPSELLKLLNSYPIEGDQTHVRPSIRSAEGLMDMGEDKDKAWPNAFWKECWEKRLAWERSRQRKRRNRDRIPTYRVRRV